jgi:sec-independent protein translocase protein TatA
MTIGWEEVLMLMIFALVIFGPKRLPEIGRQVGRAIGEIRRVSRQFEDEVRGVTEPFHRELTAAMDPDDAEILQTEAKAEATYDLDPDHSTFTVKDKPRGNEQTPPRAL